MMNPKNAVAVSKHRDYRKADEDEEEVTLVCLVCQRKKIIRSNPRTSRSTALFLHLALARMRS